MNDLKQTILSRNTLIPIGVAFGLVCVVFSGVVAGSIWVTNMNRNDQEYSIQLELLSAQMTLIQADMNDVKTQLTLIRADLNSQDLSYEN